MISAGNIWLAENALVYYIQHKHQSPCPLGLSMVQCSCTAPGRVVKQNPVLQHQHPADNRFTTDLLRFYFNT